MYVLLRGCAEVGWLFFGYISQKFLVCKLVLESRTVAIAETGFDVFFFFLVLPRACVMALSSLPSGVRLTHRETKNRYQKRW